MTRRDHTKLCCGSVMRQDRASTPGARGRIRRRSMHSSHPSPRASGSTLMPVQADKVIEIMLQCMSPEMARNGPPAMSAVWSLSEGKRTWRLRAPTSELDPKRTSAHWSGGRRLRSAYHPTVDLSAKRNKIDRLG